MSRKTPFNDASGGSKKPPDRNRFFLAAKHNHVGTLKEFLNAYDDAVTWRQSDKTALLIAVENGHYMSVQLLLEHGAKTDETQTFIDTRPLNAAAKIDRTDIAGLLLHHRAPLDKPAGSNMTPLLDAVYYNSLKVMEMLLKRHASLTVMNEDGQTALHLAAEREYPQAVALLLDHGANINARNRDGLTPLMVAAHNGGLEAARVLLERGADHYLKNDKGDTALDMALVHGDNDPDFVKGFAALIAARNRKESLALGIPFTEGMESDVRVGKPLKLKRRKPHRPSS